ncbi:50S ribosomal protein L2 [Candidatus Parcubacteria bacterium]|nr:MAG: 50S ribosomal protein L2 [Candidatus Parcubacteria bacterium]
MSIKINKPTTPSRRFISSVVYSGLSKNKPFKKLTKGRKRAVGRSWGRISTRHKGAGVKRLYRFVDFKLDKLDVPARIESLEYDPNRSAFIALVVYADGEKGYILAPEGVKVGEELFFGEKAPLKIGNRLPLKKIPVGFSIFNIEFEPRKGSQFVRSAGALAKVMAHDGAYALVELPSGEVRKFSGDCYATIGSVSNPEHNLVVIGKAGRSRLMGIRPTVRGSAMNPVDHPHGGGEGRSPIGLKHPKTPWGKIARGVKTRRKHKASNSFIISRRNR